MRPVTQKYLSALRGAAGVSVEAYVVEAGQTGVEPTGTQIEVIGGSVKLDANAAVRSVLDLTTTADFPGPLDESTLLAPYGVEIFVRVGLSFGGGAVEWVSVGYHRILTATQADAPDGPVQITGVDRMNGLIKGRLLYPKQYASSATYGTVVTELVEQIYPWATIEWDDATDASTLGRALIAEEDRHAFLDELITSIGKIWYWDHRGILVIKDVPSGSDPVWETLIRQDEISREVTAEGVYNAVKAFGEGLDATAPASAVAVDNNPDSPTYFYGDFGQSPKFYSSPFITTTAQARSAAAALLKKELGLPYRVGFSAVPNPALEPYDAVVVNLYDAPAAVVTDPVVVGDRSEIHVIDSLVIPLEIDGGVMTATTRQQTVELIGEA